jgi:hypothetical protein
MMAFGINLDRLLQPLLRYRHDRLCGPFWIIERRGMGW